MLRMQKLIKTIFGKPQQDPTVIDSTVEPPVKSDNGELIQIESGWPDDQYELFLGASIRQVRLLIGSLSFNPEGQESLVQSTLTTSLLAGRLTDNKVLDCMVKGGDRIRSGKIQKSITTLATMVCYLSEQLAKVQITTEGKSEWLFVEPFDEYVNGHTYAVVPKKVTKTEVTQLRAKLTNILINISTIKHLDACGNRYSGVLFNLLTVRDFHPLSSSIIDAINRNRIGQLSTTEEKKEKKGDIKNQLVELITQVIKNGRPNQPGSKIWSTEDSIYFLFPQAANDIRALAKTYGIEIPADTIELVNLLADKKIIEKPTAPANPKLPLYKKISITSQGVPKKPQVAIEISKRLMLHDVIVLESVDITETEAVVKKTVSAPLTVKQEAEPSKQQPKPVNKDGPVESVKLPAPEKKISPINILVLSIQEKQPNRIKDGLVSITLEDVKNITEDAMGYIRELEDKGVVKKFIINPSEPNASTMDVIVSEALDE